MGAVFCIIIASGKLANFTLRDDVVRDMLRRHMGPFGFVRVSGSGNAFKHLFSSPVRQEASLTIWSNRWGWGWWRGGGWDVQINIPSATKWESLIGDGNKLVCLEIQSRFERPWKQSWQWINHSPRRHGTRPNTEMAAAALQCGERSRCSLNRLRRLICICEEGRAAMLAL